MSERQAYAVEAADYNLAGTVRATSAREAAELAANDITNNRDCTYDGDEYDIRARPEGTAEWTYWRVHATVQISLLATQIEAPEESET